MCSTTELRDDASTPDPSPGGAGEIMGLSLNALGGSLQPASVVPRARVLVVEDNSSDVFLLERALNKQGLRFELVHLTDGAKALAFIRREGVYAGAAPPDLILVDLNLSDHDGQDILREIRAARHLTGVPVCAWSSSQSQRDRTMLTGLGITRFITKPTGLHQFMEIGKIIGDLLPRRGAVC